MAEEEEEPITVQQLIEFISSLISLSHSIRVFSAKWQLIRTKLEELNSGLFAAGNCSHSGDNPELSGVLQVTFETAKECSDLAHRCVDLSFSGKLLMQSDLDVIFVKFDRHVRNLSEIYTAGILTQGSAIVVSKPCLGACKEDMRFYLRDILTRLKIGGAEMKRQALINLQLALFDDEKYVKLIAEISDFVNLFVHFLDSPEIELQEEGAKVVSFLSGHDFYKGDLVKGGVIAPLIRVLESGSESGKMFSSISLQKLTENSNNAWSVSAHGGVTCLLKICSCLDSKPELIASSCGVLKNLLLVEEIKRFMVEEGVISTFIKLVHSTEEIVQLNSIEFLHSISFQDDSVRNWIVKGGGIRALVQVLEPRSNIFSVKSKEIALRTIEHLYLSSMNYVNVLISYGFLDHLVNFLRNRSEVSLQELALKVVVKLNGTSEETKRAMGDANFMPELVKFLEAKSFEVREIAAEALSELVLVPKNRKRFVQDDWNMSILLQLLDPEKGNLGEKRLLLCILNSLTGSNSGRKKILSSGCLKHIEKLAEAEVSSDAKRIVRKLSTNRFRSILSGIWHS